MKTFYCTYNVLKSPYFDSIQQLVEWYNYLPREIKQRFRKNLMLEVYKVEMTPNFEIINKEPYKVFNFITNKWHEAIPITVTCKNRLGLNSINFNNSTNG